MTEIKRKIHIIGINSFEFQDLPPKLQKLYIKTDNIAVPDSYISNIKEWEVNYSGQKKLFFSSRSNKKLIAWLKTRKTDVILISRGDPLWFGIGRVLLENFHKKELNFYPSNTCIQLAFNKLKVPWQNATVVSIHGRDTANLIKALKARPSNLAIITDSKNENLEIIRNNLSELNLNDDYDFWLCEEMGFEDEKIRKVNFTDLLPSPISNLNIVVLTKIEKSFIAKDLPLFGLSDDIYKTFNDRPNLLTKKDVRLQILADLELPAEGIIWDIGAGCGSIGLEALRIRPNLKLISIDKRIGSKKLIEENARRLGVNPFFVYEENINHLLSAEHSDHLKNATRIIIGGCDKKTKLRIINELSGNMCIGSIFIIPIIDIDSISEIRKMLEFNNYKTNLNLIQTYKNLSISQGIRLDPNNPVFLLKGKKLI